ncbi:target of Nesh-SH3 isoform X2 [Triplophysa dalaica]|uniref:target of Nesh-SH3 isoform X2 n=1 Tax=Triplophysa dalaica TaxID=1582913 RepID=UPI0024DF8335|nr:target of Nesh-SH3 isoform X2 [Triplophysa dalaica]
MWTIGTLYWLFSEKKDNMKVFLFLLLLRLISATKGQGQNMRVRISAFGDTITFKFLQPRVNSRLEGYILGYGSSMFSKQLIQLPEDEQPFETERDAEPKYLIAVRSANDDEPVRKQCAGKVDLEKPLHIVIGSVTDSSVLLSWGTLLTTPFTDSIVEDCVEDGHFTVRYREKEPSNNWNYQTCPTTSTVIDHLKPDALYEFEVRADTETKSGDWSPPIIHNTADQIIDEPFKELNQARTKKPDQPLSFPAVPVLKNITQVKPAPLIRQIVPPDPLITSEAEEVTTALISAEDLIPSTQPPAFPQAPILLPTTKTTSTVQHKKSTSQPSTTKSVPDKSVTPQQPLTTRQPSFIQPQTSTFHSTTHSQTNTQVSTEDQYTTKQQLITVQQQLSKTTSNPIPTQTNAPPPQSTVQEHPTPPKEQDTITPDNRHTGEIQPSTKLQRLSPVPRPRGTFKQQTTDSYYFHRTTYFYPSSTITLFEQKPNTKSPTTHTYMSTNGYSLSSKFLSPHTTLASKQDDVVSVQTTDTNKHSIFSTKSFISKEFSTFPHHTNKEQESTLPPIQPPTILWYQPHSPSTTTQSSSTSKHNTNSTLTTKHYPNISKTAKHFSKTESQFANLPPNHKEQLPGTSRNLELMPTRSMPFAKSDDNQDSPVPNEVDSRNLGRGVFRNSSSVSRPLVRNVTNRLRPNGRVSLPTNTSMHQNPTLNRKRVPSGERIIGLQGTKPRKEPRKNRGKTKTNQVSESKEKENVINLKQMEPVPLKPLAPPTTERPAYQETPLKPLQLTLNGSRFDTGDNSSVFSPHPVSEIDAMGRKRFIAPHVIYKIDKRPEEPCSVTHSLSYFPDEEVGYSNVTGPPKTPPSNVTVVTVEGCPSFVIIDWEKTDNETKEYDVESTTKGPHGKEVSIVTTNQTHTAVENLKPESSYEFKVTPKNELGSGPASDPVTFSTESADPRVSEIPTGKNAIWSSFPFKADSYSECKGRQYIKRTWYRKFVGIQLCNSLRYNIYLSDSLKGKFYSIGDLAGNGEDHCQFVDSFLDGRTGGPLAPDQLPPRQGFFRAVRQEPVQFGEIGGNSLIKYVAWYECGIPIPGKW